MIEAIWVLIIGIVLVALGYTKKAGTYSTAALAVGALMVIGGAVWPGYGLWEGEMQITPIGVTGLDEVEITMANGSWDPGSVISGVAAGDEESVTYQLNQDGTHTFDQVHLSANFTLNPIAPADATGDDLITVYFSIPDNDAGSYDADDVWSETDNIEDVDWWVNGIAAGGENTKDVAGCSGSINMKYTDNYYVTFTGEVGSAAADTFAHNMDTVGETHIVPVTFTVDGQSQTFDIIFMVLTNA